MTKNTEKKFAGFFEQFCKTGEHPLDKWGYIEGHSIRQPFIHWCVASMPSSMAKIGCVCGFIVVLFYLGAYRDAADSARTNLDGKNAVKTSAAITQTARSHSPQRLNLDHVPNAIRLHPRVLSGGLPDGRKGFAQLAVLGVKTVISVDGMKPDLKSAREFGLRYIHLPHGYDQVPSGRVREIAKAILTQRGTVFIHCHHGRHRSPAAATAACVMLGHVPSESAEATLEFCGTSPQYAGLYQSVKQTKTLPRTIVLATKTDFPEIVDPPPIVDVMVQLELILEQLETRFADANCTMMDHSKGSIAERDRDASAHQALLLQELMTELRRDSAEQKRSTDFQAALATAESQMKSLNKRLSDESTNHSAVGKNLTLVRSNCVACHQKFRNSGPSEPRKSE